MSSRARFASPLFRFARCGKLAAAVLLAPLLLPAMVPAPAVFVTSVSAPAPGTYDRTLALHFTATFNQPVIVNGAPRLALQVGDEVRHAIWMPPLGPSPATTELTFVYHPEPFDQDDDGIVVIGVIDPNGGTIQGVDTAAAALSFAAPDTRGIRVALQPPPTPVLLGLTTSAETMPAAVATGDAFVLRGTADGGSVVTVTLDGVGPVGSVAAEPNGAWSMPYPDALLSPGIHQLSAVAETPAGLVSAPSQPLRLVVAMGAMVPAER